MKPNTNNHRTTPMLNFSTDQLRNMPEYMMLRLAIDYYQLLHPEEKAMDAVAYEIGITVQALSNYVCGKGHVGFDALKKLIPFTKCELIQEWMDAR